ncbi:tetratricopeptide repeat protein [Marinicella gelatinilytica]|uniref:tetratricopeptide repeat protein n=1 Tax=Marinicella gelatinilytica TaxID=2996017 RepID=UPI0022609560|nr:tetratricopeptide repeat protein [Marinicella gelatinilytica]MCX7544093.1 tetratricopeptide repeat protein [Marinicella gelatinilytica]
MKKIIILLGFLCVGSVSAGTLKTDNPVREPSGSVGVMTESQGKQIERYSEFIADEKYSEARSGLTNMLAKLNQRDAYVLAIVYQLLGHLESTAGNYLKAADYFKKSIDTDAMPNSTHFNMMLQRAQLLMIEGKNREGLRALDDYFNVVDEIPDTAFKLKAHAHANLEEFREVKKAIKQAISLSDKPQESWYQLLLAAHSELSEYREMADVLKTLITMSPGKKTYYMQLSSVYFTLKEDKNALAALVLAYENNLLDKETDYMQLFKMYSFNDIPYKAGKVLQDALDNGKVEPSFDNWKQLGQTWYNARELDKALAAYDKASEYAKDGDIDITRAYLYVDMEKWPKAIESIQSALQKGGLDDDKTGNAWLMLGMSQASMKNYSQARNAFNKASDYKKARNNAQQWLNHLKTLEQRAEREAADNA